MAQSESTSAPAEQNKEVIEVIEKPYSVKQVAHVE